MARPLSAESIEADLAALESLDTAALQARWRREFGADPPKRISRQMLSRALAYRLQERAFGGLKPSVRKRLSAIAAGAGHAPPLAIRIKPGTRLIRDWHGQTHEVMVFDKGFHWRGETHTSLSAIARKITGTRWNGHVFFGLRKAVR